MKINLFEIRYLFLIISASLFFNGKLFTQNLIQNPSFEEMHLIDGKWSGSYKQFNSKIKEWSSPTQGSPDVMFSKSLAKMSKVRPILNLKEVAPRSGEFMAGIKTFGCLSGTMHCKEYLQIKLNRKIIRGNEYRYSFYIQPVKSSIRVNSIGIALSDTLVEQYSNTELLELNGIYPTEKIIGLNENGWIKLEGRFIADVDYEYLLIGSFTADEYVVHKVIDSTLSYSFYLIDDVELYVISGEPFKTETSTTFTLEDVLFEFDGTDISKKGIDRLAEIKNIISEQDYKSIVIEGHTDSVGTEAYNLELSQKRADNVKAELIKQGLSKEFITSVGRGSQLPKDISNAAVNRRVEIILE